MSEAASFTLAAAAIALSAAALAWCAARLPWGDLFQSTARAWRTPTARALPLPLRLGYPLVRPAARRAAPLIPRSWLQRVAPWLRRAGVDADDAAAVAEWLLLPVPASMALCAAAAAADWPLATTVPAAAILWIAAWRWLQGAGRRRELAVLRELPFHLDMLALALESGATLALALHASLPRAPSGPLRDGLRALQQDLHAGRLRADAIQLLQRRLDFPCIAAFTSALLRAERSGAGLAQALRIQAEQRRHERFHRAETLAMQAPVRMLGPLVLCIFPGTFLVLGFVIFARSTLP